jgi:catechol 2,3-dioxygenase-like lactoylglutathione lyase family enzyme
MQVKGIDHVNIIADDLETTKAFYGELLGFRAEELPGAPPGFRGCWLVDGSGRPSIHVMAYNDTRHAALERGSGTGLIDHVALACDDFEGMVRRCEEMGVEHQVNDRKFGSLRQVFVTDPSNIRLELNFSGA